MRFLLPTLAALACLAAQPAAACSPVPGYRVPTNMELTAGADLILLATVTGGVAIDDADGPDGVRIDLRPVAALKGDLASAPTSLDIALATGRFALPSNPYELVDAHPLAYIGGCTRYMVPLGSRLLFFLDRHEQRWIPAGGPFSRWAEDVLTDDAPWLAAVKFYLEVQALPEGERSAALSARGDELRKQPLDPVAQLLADDIDRQLAGPNEPLRREFLPDPDEDEDEDADPAETAARKAVKAAKEAARSRD
ncbi:MULTISPECIES: hypothetical protein [unclassified Sphingopyxis]|uniref:hypothetical protein n=1 Tax=unclassified Sphingopyxis TaxID=2614943 RepID=UPI00073798B8|nr:MULTISPECIES: hypothetical protein [unclassified Sphingopyxis]KTE24645.1 hypothetical protein ATE62_22425 [Sphingopyxis sp. HIX]KTE72576.1 hypothetical protein ATE72_22205 [Sphingopyxis sp. HXXIV]